MNQVNKIKKLYSILTILTLSIFSSSLYADSNGNANQSANNENQGWFYIGEYSHNTNSFQMSYFNATSYPSVNQKLVANIAVNMREEKPTNQGVLGNKIGMILKNQTLVVTELTEASAPNGIEDVWVKGYIESN